MELKGRKSGGKMYSLFFLFFKESVCPTTHSLWVLWYFNLLSLMMWDPPTLIPVGGGHRQHGCSRSLVFHHLDVELRPVKRRRLVVHVDDLHTQHLGGGQLRYPMILGYNGQIEDFLLLPVQGFKDGEGAFQKKEKKKKKFSEQGNKKTFLDYLT